MHSERHFGKNIRLGIYLEDILPIKMHKIIFFPENMNIFFSVSPVNLGRVG